MPTTPRLAAWRRRRALTLRELAAAAGLALRTVWRAEHGLEVRPPTVRKLAAALGVEPADLLEGEVGPVDHALIDKP